MDSEEKELVNELIDSIEDVNGALETIQTKLDEILEEIKLLGKELV